MKTTFTIPECFALRGCYSREQVANITQKQQSISINFIIDHPDIKLTEKVWWIMNRTELTPAEQQRFARKCAEIAIENYPENIKNALTNPIHIPEVRKLAAKSSKPDSYALFSVLTENPEDRAFAAVNSASDPTKFLDYFKEFFSL